MLTVHVCATRYISLFTILPLSSPSLVSDLHGPGRAKGRAKGRASRRGFCSDIFKRLRYKKPRETK